METINNTAAETVVEQATEAKGLGTVAKTLLSSAAAVATSRTGAVGLGLLAVGAGAYYGKKFWDKRKANKPSVEDFKTANEERAAAAEAAQA